MYPVTFHQLQRKYVDKREKNPFVLLIAGKKLRKCVVKYPEHFPTGSSTDEKGCRCNVLSVSHESVMTALLEEMDHTIRRSRSLRGRQTRYQRNKW
ncbi:hypothetical protein TNCV_458411 [Trichonephila clavipes]|nr:hypothetical protein TNCV_458411 [Trichonephila clavipes]